jgi:hypothetical protein
MGGLFGGGGSKKSSTTPAPAPAPVPGAPDVAGPTAAVEDYRRQMAASPAPAPMLTMDIRPARRETLGSSGETGFG